MVAPATVSEFLDLVRKSGVVEDNRLEAYAQKLRAGDVLPANPAKLAGTMQRDGLLTAFQSEQLLQGKWRRFTIGKYKVLERIGSGGMGSVYLCEHKFMRRLVAVKVLPTAKAQDPASLERFYREARAVAALDHDNIVHAYDIDQDENLHFLVMEFVDGISLQDLVKRIGPMEPVRAAHYIQQAAAGLDHAFQRGLIHRDIKPGNLLVDRLGTVKILDMGLARFFNDEEDVLTKKYDENVLGTADYLSPEQALDSHDVDVRADIYSLGATFYFLLTGRTPFGDGTTAQKLLWHQTRDPKPLPALRADVPVGLNAVIGKMMAKEAPDRYQTHQEVVDALAPWTQAPIPPPSEAEIPCLGPAVNGSGEAMPKSDPRKLGAAAKPKSNPPGSSPLSKEARARTPRPTPVAALRAQVTDLPTVITAIPKAQKTAKAIAGLVASMPTTETAPLNCLNGDTQSLDAPAAPAPSPQKKPLSTPRLRRPARRHPRRIWYLALGGAAAVLLLVLILMRIF